MPYHHKRHHGIEHEIRRVVEKELEQEIELKRQVTGFNLIPYEGHATNTVFTVIAQGNSSAGPSLQNERIGNAILAKTLHLRFFLSTPNNYIQQNGNPYLSDSVLRILVYTWVPYSGAAVAETDLLDEIDLPGAGYEVCTPWKQQRGETFFKIHHDEVISLNALGYTASYNGSAVTYTTIPRISYHEHKFHLNHTVDYQTSTTGLSAVGHIGMLCINTSGATTGAPQINGQATLYYTDA